MLKKLIIRTIQQPTLLRFFETVSWPRRRREILVGVVRGELRPDRGSCRESLAGRVKADGRVGRGIASSRFPRGLRCFPDRSARLACCAHFLEHPPCPGKVLEFLRECRRVLVLGIEWIIRARVEEDGGFFAVQAALHPDWRRSRLDHLMDALRMEGRHEYGHDIETMRDVPAQVGFGASIESDHDRSADEELDVDDVGGQDDRGRHLGLCVEATA